MFSTFEILVIYLIISSRCTCIPILNRETTTFNLKEKVKEELDPFKDDLRKMMHILTSNEKFELLGQLQGKLEKVIERAVKTEQQLVDTIQELGRVKGEKELANEWAWFELMRQQIEYFEECNFPQPSDDDFESKKILWNKERMKGKTNFELHEERRYQKFKYYLEHPPNEAVQKLRNRLDIANISVEVFSRGVAKAYRLISARIHDGYIKWLDKNLDEFFIQEEVLIAMEILLDEMGISKKLIKKIENAASKTKELNRL